MEYHAQLHLQTQNQINSSFLLSAPANGIGNGPIRKRSRTLRDDDPDHQQHHLAKKTRHMIAAETAFPSFSPFASARGFSPATSASSTEPNTPAEEDVNMEMDMQMMDTEIIKADQHAREEEEEMQRQQQLQKIQLQVQQHRQQQALYEAQQQQSQRCTIISGFNQRLRNQPPAVQTSWPNASGYF
jgi:hypothetical protein